MNQFLQNLRVHLNPFVEECCKKPVPFMARGILNIEAFYWWALIGQFKPDIILESGVANGRSTEILSRAKAYYKIPRQIAVEHDAKSLKATKKRLSGLGIEFIQGDAAKVFDSMVASNPAAMLCVIIDGPKGGSSLDAAIRAVSRAENLMSICMHDCPPQCSQSKDFPAFCAKNLPDWQCLITGPDDNQGLQHLNEYVIADVMAKSDAATVQDVLSRTDYVGICVKEK